MRPVGWVVHLRRADRTRPEAADGVVIVIDAIRAFSVAAYALAGGAERLLLLRSTDEAFALREEYSEALRAGLLRLRDSGRLSRFEGEDADFPPDLPSNEVVGQPSSG